jgi:hypothetical protein
MLIRTWKLNRMGLPRENCKADYNENLVAQTVINFEFELSRKTDAHLKLHNNFTYGECDYKNKRVFIVDNYRISCPDSLTRIIKSLLLY